MEPSKVSVLLLSMELFFIRMTLVSVQESLFFIFDPEVCTQQNHCTKTHCMSFSDSTIKRTDMFTDGLPQKLWHGASHMPLSRFPFPWYEEIILSLEFIQDS